MLWGGALVMREGCVDTLLMNVTDIYVSNLKTCVS
jgi:hypothetical protein